MRELKRLYPIYEPAVLSIKIVSWREYGQPKLSKPKKLKGVSKTFSIDFIPKKASCQCFVLDNDLYIKHVDYFSKSFVPPDINDMGMPLEAMISKYCNTQVNKKSFGYPDCWGDIVLRNECWFKIENLKQQFYQDRFILDIRHELFKNWAELHNINWTELDLQWERFFENVLENYKKHLTNE